MHLLSLSGNLMVSVAPQNSMLTFYSYTLRLLVTRHQIKCGYDINQTLLPSYETFIQKVNMFIELLSRHCGVDGNQFSEGMLG